MGGEGIGGGDYKLYTKINRYLANLGYFVISIQHELPTDLMLSMSGNLYQTRLPNWMRGVENIRFIMEKFKQLKPHLNWKNVNLIGHSNGGDMTMLFAHMYPTSLKRAISLDNLRQPLPRYKSPKIFSVRSSDCFADEGVIPTIGEQKLFDIKIINTAIPHGRMDDKGSFKESQNLNALLLEILN